MSMRHAIAITTAVIGAAACGPNRGPERARPAPTPVARAIGELVARYHEYGHFDGSVLVVDGGAVVYEHAVGLADREWQAPNTTDTRFRVGSMTKAFTATLVFQLIERGLLRLDGTVAEYLPDFGRPSGAKITIDHLLEHTAGLRDSTDFPRNNAAVPPMAAKINAGFVALQEMVPVIAQYEPLFEPGAKFSYSNDGYILLGAIVERVTNTPYAELLRRQIFDRVGMKDSGMADATSVLGKRASGYDRTLDGYRHAAAIAALSNGGMYSTLRDLRAFLRAARTDELLTQRSRDVMFGPRPGVVGYGWKVEAADAAGRPTLVLTGSLPGFTSFAIDSQGGRRLVILLSNMRLTEHKIGDLATGITNILDGKAAEPPRRSGAEALLATVRGAGPAALRVRYRELAADPTYALDERELNAAGYLLLGERELDRAIAMFELVTEAFPRSANAFDSLGEAYMARGANERAMASYRRSVELDPSNTNAVEMLKRLGSPR